MSQSTISSKNSEFWDELCGSGMAKPIGIADLSREYLKKFDDWYLISTLNFLTTFRY